MDGPLTLDRSPGHQFTVTFYMPAFALWEETRAQNDLGEA